MRCEIAIVWALTGAFVHAAGWADESASTRSGDDAKNTATSDSLYTLEPIVVEATRIDPGAELVLLPGQVTYVDIEPFRNDLVGVAEILDHVPGLHVRDYGSSGHYSSASIRGASPAQVTIYLDGVPLSRGGSRVTNLAELPFAGLDHIEVYRGFAPPSLPGSGMGGAIHLVSRPADEPASSAVVLGAGSFGTQRVGITQQIAPPNGWDLFLVADVLRSDGDFEFLDDNGTPLNSTDDQRTMRRNNWMHRQEVLAKAAHGIGAAGRFDFLHHWVGLEGGVAGIASVQADLSRIGTRHHLTSATLTLPPLLGERLHLRARLFHDWRRDWFKDPQSEIGLGFQDNRDVSQTFGGHFESGARLPGVQHVAWYVDARHETFMPWRRYPREMHGPEQRRTVVESALEHRFVVADARLRLQTVVRASREDDFFSADLFTPYSRRPARSGRREYVEPRFGARLRLLPGVHAEASYGRHHRSPGFLELFGDGGSVAGSSDLVAEEGVNRDYGLDIAGTLGAVVLRAELAHFDNRVDELITFLPQSQRTFVARNIGSARLEGEEVSCRLSGRRGALRWSFAANYTQLRTEDLGVDISWYAGKTLPGRPEQQLYSRVALDLGFVAFAYQYEHLGLNFLDRWNRGFVGRRDLHGIDVGVRLRRVSLRLVARNLTDDQARDVAGFPVPGRTVSVSSNVRF